MRKATRKAAQKANEQRHWLVVTLGALVIGWVWLFGPVDTGAAVETIDQSLDALDAIVARLYESKETFTLIAGATVALMAYLARKR